MFVMCLQILIKVFMGSDELDLKFFLSELQESWGIFDGYICEEKSYI